MEADINRLNKYMKWWIDRVHITTIDTRIRIFREMGYIEYGRQPKQLPDFDTWKKIYK